MKPKTKYAQCEAVRIFSWIQSPLGTRIRETHNLKVAENMRPNPVRVNCQTQSEGQRVLFEIQGEIVALWRADFDIVWPGDSRGPCSAEFADQEDSLEPLQTTIEVQEVDRWDKKHRPLGLKGKKTFFTER